MSFYWKGFHKPFVHLLLIFLFAFGYISQVIHLLAAHILMSSLWEHGKLFLLPVSPVICHLSLYVLEQN